MEKSDQGRLMLETVRKLEQVFTDPKDFASLSELKECYMNVDNCKT
jgi:hypothetical protein